MTPNRSRWPTPEDYDDILSRPDTALYDAKLKRKQILLDPFGQPLRLNGGGSSYVCVYRLDDWVIRCFAADPPKGIAPPPDIEERYRGIIAFQQQRIDNSLSFLVPNQWTEQGIKVSGSDFPILQLQYIANSQTLGEFLAEHYNDQKIINFLAQEWLKVIQQFEDKRVAHGDLDLSNVLIYGKYPSLTLRLVDFDGMYVPDFANRGMKLADKGHEHFQPAQLGFRKFNSEMDRFSALIIYLSLCALEMKPSLWDQCKASERRLLLGKPDFERLLQSENFARLRQERNNDRLRLCLDELERSITRGYMPRNLQDILGIYAKASSVLPRPLQEVSMIHLAIPLDEGKDVGSTSSSISALSPWQFTPAPPPSPLSVPLPVTPRTSLSRGFIIAALVILVLIIALIVFLVIHNSTPQPSQTGFVIQIAFSLPPVGMTRLVGNDDIEERQLDDEA